MSTFAQAVLFAPKSPRPITMDLVNEAYLAHVRGFDQTITFRVLDEADMSYFIGLGFMNSVARGENSSVPSSLFTDAERAQIQTAVNVCLTKLRELRAPNNRSVYQRLLTTINGKL